MRRSMLIAALAISAAFAAPALARPALATESDSVSVRYSAPELNTTAGARHLALRIRVAANRLCGGEDPIARAFSATTDCRRAAEARAAAELGAPLVNHALGLSGQAADLANR